MSRLLFAAMAGLVLLAGCGKKEETADAPSGTEEAPPEISKQSGNPLQDMMAEAEKKKQDEREMVNKIRAQTWETNIKAKEAEGGPDSKAQAQMAAGRPPATTDRIT